MEETKATKIGLSYAPGNLALVEEITGRMKQTSDEQTQMLVKP
jgi:hypothetical protein